MACLAPSSAPQASAAGCAQPSSSQRHAWWLIRRRSAPRQQRQAIAGAAPQSAAGGSTARAAVPVTFFLGGQEITVEALPGQNLWEVAKEAGADITLGCSQGSCGICEVDVRKWSASGGPPSTSVARACIAGVPPGYAHLEVHEVVDEMWSVDGYDT